MLEQSPAAFDIEEFGKLFAEQRKNFVKLAYSFMHSMGEAEDIVNDSFLYVLERRDSILLGAGIKSYLYACVRDRCYMRLRERQRRYAANSLLSRAELLRLEASLSALQDDELTGKMFSSEVYEIFCQELARMPELTRTIYLASRQNNMTHNQIAESFQITTRKVATEMQRALSMLRLSLKDYLVLMLFLLSCIKR